MGREGVVKPLLERPKRAGSIPATNPDNPGMPRIGKSSHSPEDNIKRTQTGRRAARLGIDYGEERFLNISEEFDRRVDFLYRFPAEIGVGRSKLRE